MKISKAEQAALIEDLRRIATRLAGAPEYTEQLAKSHHDAAVARNPQSEVIASIRHYPHQVGGLSQICTSSARDIEAIIRRLGGGS